jgi:hypothetical protein
MSLILLLGCGCYHSNHIKAYNYQSFRLKWMEFVREDDAYKRRLEVLELL